ncbi:MULTISPECIES: NifU family protein [unclassified Streptomyces]|uniref:NifU family protein n=1 Tax=unclassified Streptomyces TaxID=2593676 RepID=UPI0023652D4D|nr:MULTISPECIES: NifU family protein [unclassified Streptomyces]MDF3142932.1 NifU family protein [Streptomyces sp. T21Q-yed]WDF44077.1 NifU family protein [Streptomyces sp. T12]
MIPIYPQQVPGRPDRLRWIVPAGTLTTTGPFAEVPAPLAALLADGTLARITLESTAVVTCLGVDRTWREEGARVRTALHAALDDHAGWTPAAGQDHRHDDRLLYGAAREVLAGQVGDFARSHGGTIDLVGVRDGVVTVRLGGACRGCPASWFTLHQRLERQLRRRQPGLLGVRNIASTVKPADQRASRTVLDPSD